ncbi:hyaluronidase-1 [Latimeria chalumnae]|uniref:Hyaluronidase n=1 Tax=Latimeria chalumnae TaxID=7897 RepID=H3AI34_LATCH|nr:PREDICTED: hyaluronidase-1-like [Latimeria chalumnae]|eukprot:XP_005992716.1 PREDICTED: hyaluronidase-1-like [Latimeria chalumnae]
MIYTSYTFTLLCLCTIKLGWSLKHGPDPLIPNKPFIIVWNAPTQDCKSKYNVDLDLSLFDIVLNQNETFSGQNITIFYTLMLGFYPYYGDDGTPVHGGIPQNSSLGAHLLKALKDIEFYIPDKNFNRLAVIDWEAWRPLWIRNWDKKEIYRTESEKLVKEHHIDWTPEQVDREAQVEFEQAAQAFMVQTLQLGRILRPRGLWGFYGFPSCYNNNFKNSSFNYTGQCPEVEVQRNDRLKWLWKESTALYPDIYLEKKMKYTDKVLKYVRYRVKEALRVSEEATNDSIPVLPYARVVYTYTMEFLTKDDLIHTIGESAALGVSGIVLWGDHEYSRSESSCRMVKSYIDRILGQYITNVTSAVALCSQNLCSGHGRCARRDADSKAHLHLNPERFRIKPNTGQFGPSFLLQGDIGKEDIAAMAAQFLCNCYSGWEGPQCKKQMGQR